MLPSLLQKLQNETFHSDIHLNKFLMQSEVCGGNRDRCSCLLMLGSALCVIGWLYCFPLFCCPNTERDLNVSSNLAWSYCLLSWYHRGSRDGNWYGCMVKKKKKNQVELNGIWEQDNICPYNYSDFTSTHFLLYISNLSWTLTYFCFSLVICTGIWIWNQPSIKAMSIRLIYKQMSVQQLHWFCREKRDLWKNIFNFCIVFAFVLCGAPFTVAHHVNHLPLPQPGLITTSN